MKWSSFAVITLVVIAMAIYEWPRIKHCTRIERWAFAVLTAFGWVLTLLLVLYPEMPGPTQWVNAIYKPLGKILEK